MSSVRRGYRVLIDDTPVPSSLDPRVLDVDNIEVLRGPQGTLFGESSLGGNVRIITKKPSLVKMHRLYDANGLTSRAGSPDVGGNVIEMSCWCQTPWLSVRCCL